MKLSFRVASRRVVLVDDVNGIRFAFAVSAGEKNGRGILDLFDRAGKETNWTYVEEARDATLAERAAWLI